MVTHSNHNLRSRSGVVFSVVWNVWPVYRHSSSLYSQHRRPPGALWHYYSIGSRRRPIPPPSPCPGRAVTRSHWHHTHSVFYIVLYWSRADSSELIKNSCEHKESKTYTRKKERRYNGNINTNSTVWEVAWISNKKERKIKLHKTTIHYSFIFPEHYDDASSTMLQWLVLTMTFDWNDGMLWSLASLTPEREKEHPPS